MQTIIKVMILMLAGGIVACGNDQAPKAKSANAGDALAADGEGFEDADQPATDPAPINTSEKDSGETAETDKDKENDEELEDDEDDGKKGSSLTFKSSSRDDNDYSLAIRVGKKAWTQQAWPNEGESIEFPGVCKGKKVDIEIKVVHEDGKEVTKGSQLEVKADGKNATVAFEEGTGGGDPDDLVGEISCSKAKLSIK